MGINKTNLVLEHLKEHGSITSWEAIQEYGATRLSAIIFNLRKYGHIIESVSVTEKDRFDNTTTFARYIYKGEVK